MRPRSRHERARVVAGVAAVPALLRMRRTEPFGALRLDVGYAVRTLRRSPAFAAVAILSLALGIGANTTIVALVDSLVLRPLPGIVDPDGLVPLKGSPVSYPAHHFLRDELGVFSDVASYRAREAILARGRCAGRADSAGARGRDDPRRRARCTAPGATTSDVLLLGAAALLASFVPARRATHVPPTLALRAD